MKLLITLELTLLLFASTFRSHNPPGWYQVPLPVNNLINDIHFLDSLNGYVITERSGGSAYILHTTDGGSNWQIQFSENYLLTSIDFADALTGYVVGSIPPGFVLKTTNGGSNWFTVATSTFYPIRDVEFVNADNGWLCSDDLFGGGGVFRTTDGGNSWQRLTEPGTFSKLFFLNRDTGWVLTGERLFRTFNGGLNWLQNGVFDVGMKDVSFLNVDSGWVIRNSDNGIYRTTNGGQIWLREGDPFPFNSGLGEIQMLSGTKGWIPNAVRGMFAMNEQGVWGRQAIPGNNNYFRVSFVDSVSGYAGGVRFSRTDDGGGIITSNNQQLLDIPESYRLHQNYPNPFNPTTKISFELAKAGNAELSVFDIRGVKVKTLINKLMSAGTHVVDFNASNLPSGVYFYSLHVDGKPQSGRQIGVKRMTLVK